MEDGDYGYSPFGSNVPGAGCKDPDCPCQRPLERAEPVEPVEQ